MPTEYVRDDEPVIPQRVGTGSAYLVFDSSGAEEMTVTFRSGATKAAVVAYDTASGLEHLAAFFRDMEAEWKGWDGAREWSSLEGHVHLSATHHRVIVIRFVLSPQSSDIEEWALTGTVQLEPGEQLSAVAEGMDALFHP